MALKTLYKDGETDDDWQDGLPGVRNRGRRNFRYFY